MHTSKRRGLINNIKILLTLSTNPRLLLPPPLIFFRDKPPVSHNRIALVNFCSSVSALERSLLFSPLPLLPSVDLLILPRNSEFQKFYLLEESITQHLKALRVTFPASALAEAGIVVIRRNHTSSP